MTERAWWSRYEELRDRRQRIWEKHNKVIMGSYKNRVFMEQHRALENLIDAQLEVEKLFDVPAESVMTVKILERWASQLPKAGRSS